MRVRARPTKTARSITKADEASDLAVIVPTSRQSLSAIFARQGDMRPLADMMLNPGQESASCPRLPHASF
jgi:hypothetical protein